MESAGRGLRGGGDAAWAVGADKVWSRRLAGAGVCVVAGVMERERERETERAREGARPASGSNLLSWGRVVAFALSAAPLVLCPRRARPRCESRGRLSVPFGLLIRR